MVRKAKGKSKKNGKPVEKNSKVLAMTWARDRKKVSLVKPAKILAATLADEAGEAEGEDEVTLPESVLKLAFGEEKGGEESDVHENGQADDDRPLSESSLNLPSPSWRRSTRGRTLHPQSGGGRASRFRSFQFTRGKF